MESNNISKEEEEGVEVREEEGEGLDLQSVHSCDTEGYYTSFHDFDGFQQVKSFLM